MPTQIADSIAVDIIEERYAPGDRLNENALATAWGVSRSPLREALRILEKRGLVVITPQRGARVTSLSPEEVEHLFEIRSVLVGLAARRVAARSDPHLTQTLEPLLHRLEQSVDDGEQYARASAAATLAIAEAAENPRLAEMIVSFAHQIGRYARIGLSTQSRRDRSVRNWRRLFDAIRTRDADGAEACQRKLANENRDAALKALRTRLAAASEAATRGRQVA